jgi:cytochrome c556
MTGHEEGCMRGKAKWLAFGTVLTFGLTLVAGEKPPESYVKNMKETNAAAQELRKNVEAKNYDAVAKNAATLKTLFENTQSFWETRKMDDAVELAKNGGKSAGELETAAKGKNEEGVQAAYKTLNATCKTCHDAHRERLPDGTSEIK